MICDAVSRAYKAPTRPAQRQGATTLQGRHAIALGVDLERSVGLCP